jgi:hypothetical protein
VRAFDPAVDGLPKDGAAASDDRDNTDNALSATHTKLLGGA